MRKLEGFPLLREPYGLFTTIILYSAEKYFEMLPWNAIARLLHL